MDDFEKLLNKRLEEDREFKTLWEEDAPRQEIIDKIISLRIEHQLTQKEMAEKLGTSTSAIARIENGKVNPSINFLLKLGKVFNKRLVVNYI
jgi:DNA-binding XRE family transcriptional regulator